MALAGARDRMNVLTIDGGSSSLKVALYEMPSERCIVTENVPIAAQDDALDAFVRGCESKVSRIDAVGHRIVFGGEAYVEPVIVTPAVLETMHHLVPFDPLHLTAELAAVTAAQRRLPHAQQVLCFDTAFHREMPRIATRYPLGDAFAGVRRFGYHGLSLEYVVSVLGESGRTIVAHLGSGASVTAIRDAKAVDTSMGFTPLGGIMMGTRPGDLDPGVLLYALSELGMTPVTLRTEITERSGLFGVSGRTSDMRDLLARATSDARAAEAIELFVYIARKHIAALIAVLGGLDTLVFTGGIGENSGEIRERIADGLAFALPFITRVIATNESLVIARKTYRLTAR